MGVLGTYIDALPDGAKDRLIEAQEWCLGDVAGPGHGRCLIGHAEDWTPIPAEACDWTPGRWPEARRPGQRAAADDTVFACSREFFAFRRMQPMDLAVYHERLLRWGLASESRIGSAFDRLCVRRGIAGAIRLVKARAARGMPGRNPPAPAAPDAATPPRAARLTSAGPRTSP
jgi:hypothetical protein